MNKTPSDEPTWPSLQITLPDWVEGFLPSRDQRFETEEARMDLVIRLAAENVRRKTGGPFAAAIFEVETGRLVAPGLNIVVPSKWSGAHAEMLACALAQQISGTYDLGSSDLPDCELVTCVEPCAMCLGAISWAGLRKVVYGARDFDARSIGFREGHKPRDWPALFRLDGIEVEGDVLRPDAVAVLQEYARSGGPIYNGRNRS